MTVPKWLVPALAIVAALAVGVAATLLGRALTTPDAVAVPSGTVVVPVLAPVPEQSHPSDEPAGETAEAPVSETVAEREITLPASDPEAIDPALTALIDTLADAADPVFTLMERDADADGDTAGGDPCAPREGEPGEDCPDGLMSTVLATTSVIDFRAGGQAFPPTREQFLEHGNPTGGSIYCDGLTPASDEVPFGIVSTVPGTFTVRYWPSAQPDEELVVAGIESSASDIAGFQQALADGVDPFSVIGMPRHCLTLPGIEPDTVYTAVVSGVDVMDRVSEPHTLRFNSAGAPVRPGAQITTMGENLVFVAAPHTRDQSAEARVLLVDDAAEPSCAIPDSGSRSLWPLTDVEAETDADTLIERNIRPDYTRKRVQTFVLPEGSTALVCVRWYPAGSAPSWQREQPIFESSAMLQNPDRVLPSASVDAIRGYPDELESIRIGFASAEGTQCGIPVSWRPGGELRLPVELCGPGSLRSGGVQSTGERLWDVGFSGDLVATFTPRVAGADGSPTRVLLPARDGGCRGTCEVPARDRYVVPLDGGAGTVELSVGWEQGASNGRESWNVTPTVDVAPEYVRPELPQFDLDARWTVADPGGRSSTSATFPLKVDRDVDYTMRLTTGAAGVAAPRCGSDDAVLEVSGSARAGTAASAALPVNISGLCAGEVYRAELELTAADGAHVVWGFADRDAWWAGGLVQVPGVDVTLSYSLHAQGYTHSYLSEARIVVGHAGVDLTRTLDPCDADGVIQASGTFEGTIAAENDVVLTLRLQNSGNWSPESCSGNLDGEPASTVLVRVSLDELLAGGVEVTAPEPFRATLRLSARPAAG